MVIYAKDTYQLPQKYVNNNIADLTGYTGRRRGKNDTGRIKQDFGEPQALAE